MDGTQCLEIYLGSTSNNPLGTFLFLFGVLLALFLDRSSKQVKFALTKCHIFLAEPSGYSMKSFHLGRNCWVWKPPIVNPETATGVGTWLALRQT